MEEVTEVAVDAPEEKIDGRTLRKRTERRLSKTGKRYPMISRAMKIRWAKNKDYRKRMERSIKRQMKARRADATKSWSRRGTFDGMTREESRIAREVARESVKATMAQLIDKGVIDGDDKKANEALEAALQVMREPTQQNLKLQAAKIVLDFTKAKPTSKQEVTVKTAEDWLASVVADAEAPAADE
jgi:hypothetical protein